MRHFLTELTPLVLCVAFVAGVLGNLAASALLGAPALWHLHRKLNRHHAELTSYHCDGCTCALPGESQ